MSLLEEAKIACRVISDGDNTAAEIELNRLIRAALKDLDITDIDSSLLDYDMRAYLMATEDGKALYGDGKVITTEGSTASAITEEGVITLVPLIKNAVILYCRFNYPYQLPEHVYRQLKEAYDEQKKQMLMSSEYTTWKRKNA